MVAFQVGDEPKHYTEAWGHEVNLTFHRRRPETVAGLLTAAGFEMWATTVREPSDYSGIAELRQQAYLIAKKPATAAG
jgi:hypothetical protein